MATPTKGNPAYNLLVKYQIQPPLCGFSIPKGWIPLVDKLIADLLAIGWDGDIQQGKEKFGGLRFYVGKVTPEQHALIQKAEALSYDVCDECGLPKNTPTHPGRDCYETTIKL